MGRDTVPGFGARLRELREAAGLTQAAMADRAGTHFTTVSQAELDKRSVSFRLAIAFADALGVKVDDLVPKKGKRK